MKVSFFPSYLDDRHDVGSGFWELGHIHIEVIQPVPLSPLEDKVATFPYGMDATKVSSRVQGGIWGFGDGELWDGRRQTTPFETRRFQRGIGSTSTVDGHI